ncbi:hypothetical protein HYH03_005789 [Edaphochlamys debaryana]|uniref:BACK domain-containing protein n=1 Tax=Edaphochlamys debaryana TaxID=47281 RepID=A0A835YEL7_9CHLO|nr:hypothetical protein HYH03_005789 [Edaphochlamys debaryana]|eukprot:KAG2496189.1 hypothetical protein HYH03_005789 [Edaphochlamys debaryana]
MAPLVNPRVADALSRLFGSETDSDCDIQFCLEGAEEAGGGAELGPLVPAHSFVLRLACERFRAQPLKKVLWPQHLRKPATRKPLRLQQRKRACPKPAHTPNGRPLLRVPLGSEAELPAARLALRFAYTGQVHASSVREALEVLRAGDYLAIEGCAAACSQWLADRLAATGAEAGSAESAEPAVLQLYACEDLWPSNDPSFAPVVSAAKAQLVRRFGSTLAALNTPALTKQLEALGPQGLEALLESDDLGTDSEDSVLTLLATWMRANWARTDAATRKRLCGLVRLTQLSIEATNCLLLPLAAGYEARGPEERAGWFPISVAEAALVSSYHSASESWRKPAREKQVAARAPGWHSASPRKQCVPAGGMAFPWSISKDVLRPKLEGLQPGRTAHIYTTISGGKRVLYARGLAWEVKSEYGHGKATAGLFLTAQIPAGYKVPGSQLAAGSLPEFPAFIDARLTVNRRQGGEVSNVKVHTFMKEGYMCLNSLGWGIAEALPLSPQQPAAAEAAAGGGDVLAGWAEYAHEGSAVTGTVTLLRPK